VSQYLRHGGGKIHDNGNNDIFRKITMIVLSVVHWKAMCSEVDNLSPWFFSKFSDLFSFYICNEYPVLPDCSYAIASHSAEYCPIETDHWHLLIIDTEPKITGLQVPCPYSCFRLLILESEHFEYSGDLFAQMHAAILYAEKTHLVTIDECRRNLPTLIPATSFINKLHMVASGYYANEFHHILKLLHDGAGSMCLNNDKISVCIKLK
jgi:hypothetical protein